MTKILHIEDNRANRLLLERILLPHGYELIQAEDGETGVGLAMDERPDLILVDMGLPDIDGQTVATLLRQIPELKKIPLVAITAWPEEKAQQMADLYGFDGCITKPLDIRAFPGLIAQYLSSSAK
jgi:two-component system cell cycle response regulator DivK